MSTNGRTVVTCVTEEGIPKLYSCVDDTGDLREVSLQEMKYILTRFPGYVRNLVIPQVSPPYAVFPTVHNGDLVGTVLCRGVRGTEQYFRVCGMRTGEWYLDDIDEEEAVVRVKRGLIVNASVRGKKIICKVPLRQDVMDTAVKDSKAVVSVGKRVDVALLYITEASNEYGKQLRYAGMEFTGSVEAIEGCIQGFTAQSLMFRQEYLTVFGRADESLALQTIPGRFFVVLPYGIAEKYLLSGKRSVKISRVIVSVLAYRGGSVFDESRVVLSGILGCGEVRGSGGYLDEAVKQLAVEVQKTFKSHVYLRSKQNK